MFGPKSNSRALNTNDITRFHHVITAFALLLGGIPRPAWFRPARPATAVARASRASPSALPRRRGAVGLSRQHRTLPADHVARYLQAGRHPGCRPVPPCRAAKRCASHRQRRRRESRWRRLPAVLCEHGFQGPPEPASQFLRSAKKPAPIPALSF